jgi:hypothetical protein
MEGRRKEKKREMREKTKRRNSLFLSRVAYLLQ